MTDTNDLVGRAVIKTYGERCSDFDANCICCRSWAELDRFASQQSELSALRQQAEAMAWALEFYAEPETYHACAFMFDRPTGGFDEDFDDEHGHEDYDRPMPGKRARSALQSYRSQNND